jgi:hypothetical protein
MCFKTSAKEGIAVTAPVPRRANGTVMKGYTANPGGRPTSTLNQVREALLPDLPLFLERLAELTQSSNETIRLQALREILDRLLGKPPVAIDSTVVKADVGAMYLAALKRAHSHGAHDNSNAGAASDQTEIQ